MEIMNTDISVKKVIFKTGVSLSVIENSEAYKVVAYLGPREKQVKWLEEMNFLGNKRPSFKLK